MRGVLWLVAALAILYGGYWAVGSRAVLGGTEATLAEMKAAGLGDYASVGLTGFPSRFDLTIQSPVLKSADGFYRWAAPEVQVYALSYKPHHVIAVLPPSQKIAFGRDETELTSEDMRASAVFGIDTDLPLMRAQAVGSNVALVSKQNWGISAKDVRFAIRQGTSPELQEIGVELLDLVLSGQPAAAFEAVGTLPAAGERARLDAVLSLDRPLDRFATTNPARIMGADIRALDLDWGPVRLNGKGQLTVTSAGHPEGRLDFGIRNWRTLVKFLTGLGLVREELAPTLERVLEQMALAGGDADLLSLPLVFEGGRMSLGPIPLGPAPRF